MKQKLLDELMKVSEEEQKYLDGQGDIEKQLYQKLKIGLHISSVLKFHFP